MCSRAWAETSDVIKKRLVYARVEVTNDVT